MNATHGRSSLSICLVRYATAKMSGSSALPFLYQTRTLLRISNSSLSRRLLCSHLHTSASRRSSPSSDPIPFELPPEFKDAIPLQSNQRRSLGPQGTITPSERATFDRIFDEIAARGQLPGASRLVTARSDTRSTEDGEDALSPQSVMELASNSADGTRISSLVDPSLTSTGRVAINAIMSDAAATYQNAAAESGGFDRFHPLESSLNTADRGKALLRFPPSLRRAATLALGVMDAHYQDPEEAASTGFGNEGSAAATSPTTGHGAVTVGTETRADTTTTEVDRLLDNPANLDPLSRHIEIETARFNLRHAIEERMKHSKNDLELWNIMVNDVFSLPKRLGIEEGSNPRPRRGVRAKPRKSGASKGAGHDTTESELSMDVHGPCYPSLLLYGLRLLDDKFATTSPLALSILPQIKELGLASYVLGVSTPFYNTLVSIYWYRYGDLNAVLELLEEMRHAGLYFDAESRLLVRGIYDQLSEYSEGRHGPVLQAIMGMPKFQAALKSRCKFWLSHIDQSMKERRFDVEF